MGHYTTPKRAIHPLVDRLTSERARRGETRKHLAERMGYDASRISRYERGLAMPGLRFLNDWTYALDMDLVVAARKFSK